MSPHQKYKSTLQNTIDINNIPPATANHSHRCKMTTLIKYIYTGLLWKLFKNSGHEDCDATVALSD